MIELKVLTQYLDDLLELNKIPDLFFIHSDES